MKNGRINFDINTILKVGKKSNNVCSKCKSNEELCVHHITPLSKGGNNEIENLILLCKFCHKLVHKNKGEFYNESKSYPEEYNLTFEDSSYPYDTGWKMDIDDTDHFDFLCPKCKTKSIITNIELREYNSLNLSPCFYFFLKCPKCKLKGQRKGYVNYSIEEIKRIKEGEDGKEFS